MRVAKNKKYTKSMRLCTNFNKKAQRIYHYIIKKLYKSAYVLIKNYMQFVITFIKLCNKYACSLS